MTQVSFTSGELFDLMTLLDEKVEALDDAEEYRLGTYYFRMAKQLQKIAEKLDDFQPENRVANLVLIAN